MTFQLDLNFANYDEPNPSGVFADCEVIAMPKAKNRITAEIRVAFTSAGFAWGSSALMETQGYGGMPNICDIPAGLVVPTRAQAIAKACNDIYRHCHKVGTKGASMILKWAEEIRHANVSATPGQAQGGGEP